MPDDEIIERWDCDVCGAKLYVPRARGVLGHRVGGCPGRFVKRVFVCTTVEPAPYVDKDALKGAAT